MICRHIIKCVPHDFHCFFLNTTFFFIALSIRSLVFLIWACSFKSWCTCLEVFKGFIKTHAAVRVSRCAHAACEYTPGWLLKSRMRWCDCRRSGFDDDRFPLTGRAAGICLDGFIPTMLSSCDWPTQTSLWKQEEQRDAGKRSSSVNDRQTSVLKTAAYFT